MGNWLALSALTRAHAGCTHIEGDPAFIGNSCSCKRFKTLGETDREKMVVKYPKLDECIGLARG